MSARKAKAAEMDRALTIEMDQTTTARVVASLVQRGDISALTAEERTRYYVSLCESLGLNPTTQPFAILRLNGKEVLYPTRGATDQLAAIHRVNREIVDGPRLIDLAGTKLVYCLCRASLPNGRVETATATVPLQDPVNVLMRCETKAKRRATLSILGLAMLDETELETIPSHLKSQGTPIEVPGAPALSTSEREPRTEDEAAETSAVTEPVAETPAHPEIPAALLSFNEKVAEIELPGEAVNLWIKFRPELAQLTREDREAAWKSLCERTEKVGGLKNAKAWLKKAIAVEDARRGKPENDQAA